MLESSISNSNKMSSQRNLIQDIYSQSDQNFISNQIDTNSSSQELQNLVHQMILNLVAKTKAELITISTITQKYKEIAAQKN